MADKKQYVDNGWYVEPDGEHAVTELTADRTGALSPFGDLKFPLKSVPYLHPVTVINK